MAERQPSKLAVVGSSPIARFFPLRKSTDTKTGTTKPGEPKISFGSISMPLEILQDKQRLNSLKEPIELKAGMVFAVETFCPAKDGVSAARIEEEVVLTPSGAKIITLFPAKELPIANEY